MSLPAKYIGEWHMDHSENFDEWMKARGRWEKTVTFSVSPYIFPGMNYLVRKIAGPAMSRMTKVIKDNGDGTYTIENRTVKRDVFWTFKLGEQFEAKAMDDKMHKVG